MRRKGKKNSENGKEKAPSREPSPAASDKSETEYEVEEIMDKRKSGGKTEYLVRWKGFSPSDDTWEAADKLSCPDLIETFENDERDDEIPLAATTGQKKKRGRPKKEPINDYVDGDDEDNDQKQKRKRGRPKKEPNNDFVDGDDGDNAQKQKRKRGRPKKGAKEPLRDDVDGDDEDDEREYEVSKIIEVHHKKNGDREFLVRWKGYGKDEDTWEPEKNLSCNELIEAFMKKVAKAKQANERETRVARKATDRYVVQPPSAGRKLSGRTRGPRRTYYDED